MKKNNGSAVSNRTAPKWVVLFADSLIPAPRQNISESFIRQQAEVPDDHEILRDHNNPDDPVIAKGADIDLKEGSVFYSRPKCGDQIAQPICSAQPKFVVSLDDQHEVVVTSDQTKESILELFGINHSVDLFKDLESPDDFEVETNKPVSLCEGNVFITRCNESQPTEITIIVNTRKKTISKTEVTYDEIIDLAFDNPPSGQNICITVTYRRGPSCNQQGTLIQGGEPVQTQNGMIFDVTATDKS